MGKTLNRPKQRFMTNIAGRTQHARPQPTPVAAPKAAEVKELRSVASEDAAEVRRVLDGCYDAPGLSFAVPPSILDVGAHVGATSNYFLRRYPGCSIQAYEPHPSAAAAFSENLRDAGWSVTLHVAAVVGIGWRDRAPILFDGKDSHWHRSLHHIGHQLTTGTKVDTNLASDLPEADILKLATNGCEIDILDSYAYLMKLRAVLVRCSRQADQQPIVDRLRASGLSLVREGAPEMVFVRKA